ncbi:MAG: hypothetical protein EG823_02025 [Actinobacteria bacterium]|nr:hypothetical protein [Actinomycetota bacterium]
MTGADKQTSGWLNRISPGRLSSRLTVSITITGAVVYVLVATIIGVSLGYQTRLLATVHATGQLAEARTQLDLQARELSALAIGFTEWDEFYDATSTPDQAFIESEFDPWLKNRADASAVVWSTSDGTIISTAGDPADVEALLDLAAHKPAGARGPMSLPTGPAVVAVLPVVGSPAGPSLGTVGIARPISADQFEASGIEGISITTGHALPTAGDGWVLIDTPKGYVTALLKVSGGLFLTRAALLGVDGQSVLTLEMARPDPWLGEDRAWAVVLIPLALGLVVLGVGYLLGTALGRSIVRPLYRFVSYLQDQGYLALQGLRTDDQLLVEPGLPDDFRSLGAVIKDLMTQLRVNQSDLIEAGDQAVAAERAFRTVVEESPEVKILVRGGVVEIANPAAAHFFGLQLGDLLRAEPDGLFAGIQLFGENDEPLELLDVARQAHDSPVVAKCVAPGQPDRWIEISVAFIDEVGSDYVISARNITEERRLEALRQEVLSLVSHDLRSPLTVVRGYLDILEKPLDDTRRTTAVESARRAATRMEGLLDDLLHATRAERVFAPRVMRPVDLPALLESVASSLQMGAEQTIVTSLEPDILVLGDSVRLEQAVTNLVGNAVKHGPPDGEIRLGLISQDGRAVVSVEDEGPGIPADQREAVFERGARGEHSAGTPGMGLGLYIVRVVAEAHGGRAFADDSPEGTRFVLDLPVMQTESD